MSSTTGAAYRVLDTDRDTRGPDVLAVKTETLDRLRARRYKRLPKDPDSTWGDRYADLAADALYALGAAPSTVRAARGGRLTVGAQRMIRGHRRNATQLALATARLPEVRKRARASADPDVTPGGTPKIVRLNAPMTKNQGDRGPWYGIVGHYTAGPRDSSDSHALALDRQYNDQHRRQGWGAIGYAFNITSDGTIILLRPVSWKGTHVAGGNTGRVGVMVHGGPGQRMTAQQRSAWRWLLANGHTTAMPASHRFPSRPPKVWVHNDLNSTACPGTFESDFKAA